MIQDYGFDAKLADLEQTASPYDIIISLDGVNIAFAEVKARTIDSKAYSETLIPVKKINRLMELSFEMKLTPLVIFKYTDKSLWLDARDIDKDKHRIGTAIRRKPRKSGIWLNSDKGHDAYYIPVIELFEMKQLKDYLNDERGRNP